MAEEQVEFPINVNDRVKRSNGKGSQGTVKDVRHEVTSTKGDVAERGLLVVVQWDNGTCSYATPGGLEKLA